MKENTAKIIMNPTRIRIVQYLLLHGQGRAKDIKEDLSDIAPASIYRHINTLVDAKIIKVVKETKIRGTIEKTYEVDMNSPDEDVATMIQNTLLMIMQSFQKYFSKENVDPQKDLLSLTSSVLLLDDEEMINFLQEISEAVQKRINNKSKEGRKPRQIVFMSVPGQEEKNVKNK